MPPALLARIVVTMPPGKSMVVKDPDLPARNLRAETVAALTRLVSDPAIRVREMYANWRYEAAQKALIQISTDRGADPLDRLHATDAIGSAVRFQVKGVRQDPPMFQ